MTWRYSEEAVVQSHNSQPHCTVPSISPGNRAPQTFIPAAYGLEVGKSDQWYLWGVGSHRLCWGIARMRFLGAADLYVVEPPMVSGSCWEKHGLSSTPHAPERSIRFNPLMPLLCREIKFSSVGGRTSERNAVPGYKPNSIFLDKILLKCKVAHLLSCECPTDHHNSPQELLIQCRGNEPRCSSIWICI